MNYPSTSQYIETLLNPEGLFQTLLGVSVLDGDEPEFRSGNFGVVFKVSTLDGTRALKCFTQAQAGRLTAYERISSAVKPSEYMVDYRFLDNEIYVFDDCNNGQYYPILLMDWIEGDTFATHIHRAVTDGKIGRLRELAAKFDSMCEWLLNQTFAHNDLKPDNIMIRNSDDRMLLIDYDGMFVESMQGEAAREFGTEPFQSPNRRSASFDRHVDNYSIAYLRRALELLIDNPQRYVPDSVVCFTDAELAQIEYNHIIYGSDYQFLGDPVSGIRVYKDNGKYGFVKSNGAVISSAVFESVHDFGDSLAAVNKDGKWGYIDSHGKVTIPFIYDDCTTFSYGFAGVRVGRKWGFIDLDGKRISKFVYDNCWTAHDGLALACRNGKYGFVAPHGRVAISFKYDFAQNFTDKEGLACVKLGDKYGYIKRNGKWWQEPIYDYACSFRDGQAIVELNGKELIIKIDD